MSEVSRRSAVITLAAGAVGVTAAGMTASGAPGVPRAGQALPPVPAWDLAAVAEAARRFGPEVERRPGMRVGEAMVLHCRSWDGHVYLYMDQSVRGFVAVNGPAFAIAAACQAAGRPAAVLVWGHEPQREDGVGRFEGAMLAMQVRDLPTETSLA